MADLVVTASSVAPVTNSTSGVVTQIITGIAGAAINAGQSAYLDTSVVPANYKLTVSTSSTASVVAGVAMNNTALNQAINLAVGGDIYFGNVNQQPTTVVTLGLAAGGLDTNAAQATTDWYPSIIGVFVGTTQLRLAITTNQGNTHT